MEKRTFTLDSSDGKSKLSGFLFLPEGHPRAVVQICHGMCEYILRYEELAQHLTDGGSADQEAAQQLLYLLDELEQGALPLRADGMGHDAIYYWPDVAVERAS